MRNTKRRTRTLFNKLLLRVGDRVKVAWLPSRDCIVVAIRGDDVALETMTKWENSHGGSVVTHRYAYVNISRIKEVLQ